MSKDVLNRVGDARTIGIMSPNSFSTDHSDFVQITLKLAKDFINQVAVPVS